MIQLIVGVEKRAIFDDFINNLVQVKSFQVKNKEVVKKVLCTNLFVDF